MATGCVYWLAGHNEISKALEAFRDHYGWKDDNDTTTYLAFGYQSSEFQSTCKPLNNAKLQRPVEFLINLYREHGTKKPFCDSIFDLKEQLIALQLVMAQLNKEETGEFTVKMQDVLDTHKAITKCKLSMDDDDDDTITKLCTAYNKFLSHCNAVDFVDVLQRVKTYFIVDSNLKDMFQTSHQFVVLGKPKTDLERQILLLVVGNRTMVCFTGTKDCNNSLSEKTVDLFLRERPEENANQPLGSPMQRICKSNVTVKSDHEQVAKDQLLKVLLSYLRLLVNSRDELALSQAINIPYRELAHKQFTALRKVAREKNMPMFQTAVSFILRIRLGGKSYAPSDDNPLLPLTKGLGEFVTFFQKLQNICEETADAKAAIFRIINMLKVSITKSKENIFTKQCIGEVVEFLQQKVEQLSSENSGTDKIASTMVGMKVYLLIQALLDQQVKQTSLQEYQRSDVNCVLMTPETTTGKSKMRSMLSQFRTPDPESQEEATKEQPPETKPEKQKPFDNYRKVCGDMNWARPAVSIKIGPSPANKRDHMVGAAVNTDIISSHKNSVIKDCIEVTPKCHSKKRTLKESMCDKENINVHVPSEDIIDSKPPAKRILLERDTTGIKSSKGKVTGKAKSHRKQIKLLQGQRQLTKFFR